jgi:hypothetical protein
MVGYRDWMAEVMSLLFSDLAPNFAETGQGKH